MGVAERFLVEFMPGSSPGWSTDDRRGPALVGSGTVVPSVWGMDRWWHRSKGLVASLRYMGRCRSRQRTVGQGLYSVWHFDVIACLSGGLDVWDGGHVAMFFSA